MALRSYGGRHGALAAAILLPLSLTSPCLAHAASGGLFIVASQERALVAPPRLLADVPALFPQELRDGVTAGLVRLELTLDSAGEVRMAQVVSHAHPLFERAALDAAMALRFAPALAAGTPVASQVAYSYRFEASAPPEPVTAPMAVPPAAPEPPGKRDDIEGREGGAYETRVVAAKEQQEAVRVSLEGGEVREVPGTMGDPFRVVMLMPGVGSVASGLGYPVVRGASPASTAYLLDGVRVPILYHLFLGPAVIHPDFIDGLEFYPGAPPTRFGRMLGSVVEGRVRGPQGEAARLSLYADLLNAGAFVELPLESLGAELSTAGRFSYSPWLLSMAAKSDSPGSADFVLDFWDYQVRLQKSLAGGALRLLGFGSSDRMGTQSDNPALFTSMQGVLFHRLDLRYRHPLAEGELEVGGTLGLDRVSMESNAPQEGPARFAMEELSGRARLLWNGPIAPALSLSAGGDMELRRATAELQGITGGIADSPLLAQGPRSDAILSGGFTELEWAPDGKRWRISPGLRLDDYYLAPATHRAALEPRLAVRRSLGSEVTLKGGAGLYHQAPTTLISLPVVDVASLQYGLQEAWQFDIGAEYTPLRWLELRLDLYYNPMIRTLELNPFAPKVNGDTNGTSGNTGGDGLPRVGDLFDGERFRSSGSAYGLELMLRKRLGGAWFGWISYSLQRSTRLTTYTRRGPEGEPLGSAVAYLPYVFDQTHLFNAVLSLKLGAWTLGGVLHFNTGRPESGVMTSTTMRPGSDAGGRPVWIKSDPSGVGRLPSFLRFDLRIARAFTFDAMQLEAYLDLMNATFSSEVLAIDYEGGTLHGGGALRAIPQGFPVVLPILGVKATWLP